MAERNNEAWISTAGAARAEVGDGTGRLHCKRPDERRAMTPTLSPETAEALTPSECSDRAGVVTLAGVGTTPSRSGGDFLRAKLDQGVPRVHDHSRHEGLAQGLDATSHRPDLGSFRLD